MLTKIIKPGKKLRKIRFECELCGCVFEKSARWCMTEDGSFWTMFPNCGKICRHDITEAYKEIKNDVSEND